MAKRRAIIGFKGIALSEVTQNDILGYKSAAAASLPFAGQMNRTPKEKSQDVYYDDDLYARIREVSGEDVEIRLGEVSLEQLEELGLGAFDETTGRFEGAFSPKPGTYSLRCVTGTVDKLPYYWNWRVFELDGIRFDNFATKGDSIAVCEIIITGVFKNPRMATLMPYVLMRLNAPGGDGVSDNEADCQKLLTDGETFPTV